MFTRRNTRSPRPLADPQSQSTPSHPVPNQHHGVPNFQLLGQCRRYYSSTWRKGGGGGQSTTSKPFLSPSRQPPTALFSQSSLFSTSSKSVPPRCSAFQMTGPSSHTLDLTTNNPPTQHSPSRAQNKPHSSHYYHNNHTNHTPQPQRTISSFSTVLYPGKTAHTVQPPQTAMMMMMMAQSSNSSTRHSNSTTRLTSQNRSVVQFSRRQFSTTFFSSLKQTLSRPNTKNGIPFPTLSTALKTALPYCGMLLCLPFLSQSISESFSYLDDYLEDRVDRYYDNAERRSHHTHSHNNNNRNNNNNITSRNLNPALDPYSSSTSPPSLSTLPTLNTDSIETAYSCAQRRLVTFLSPLFANDPPTPLHPTFALLPSSSPHTPLALARAFSALCPSASTSGGLLASRLRQYPDEVTRPGDVSIRPPPDTGHYDPPQWLEKRRFPHGRPPLQKSLDDMTVFEKFNHLRTARHADRDLEWYQDPDDPYEVPPPNDQTYPAVTMSETRPPYTRYDVIRHAFARKGIHPDEGRHLPFTEQMANITELLREIWDVKTYARPDLLEVANPLAPVETDREDHSEVDSWGVVQSWDPQDWTFYASLWAIRHATPRYRYEYRRDSHQAQAERVRWGLQPAPPLWIDGVVYPTVDHYMAREGFYNQLYKGSHYNLLTPWCLFGLWFGISLKYFRDMSPHRSQMATPKGRYQASRGPNPATWWFDHFTLSYDNRFRFHTYFTSAHAHFTLPHLVLNSTVLFATWKNLGITQPLQLFGMFTILSFFGSIAALGFTVIATKVLLWRRILRPALLTPALGASGGLAGMIAINALTHPEQKINLFFLPHETELIDILQLLMTVDSLGFLLTCFGKSTGIAHAGHLGGYISGICLFVWMKQRYEIKYPMGSYQLYLNWVENTFWQKKREDVVIPTQDTTGVASRHIFKMNGWAR